jgi:hypothetical protein
MWEVFMSKETSNNGTVKSAWISWSGAIIAAIIVCVGTIIGAALLIPRTPTPIPDTTPTVMGVQGCSQLSSILQPLSDKPAFEKDFQNGDHNGFAEGEAGHWEVIGEGNGNMAFQADNSGSPDVADVRFGESSFTDGCIQYRLKLVNFDQLPEPDSGVEFHFRISPESGIQNYVFVIQPKVDRVQLFYVDADEKWHKLKEGTFTPSLNRDEWYSVVVDVKEDKIKLFLNGEIIVDAKDSTLHEGKFALGVAPTIIVQFDDVIVWNSEP